MRDIPLLCEEGNSSHRQSNRESRAGTKPARNADRPALAFDGVFHDGESQAGTA